MSYTSPPSHITNAKRNTPIPLKFLPEARRYKVYNSFTNTPKHKKNLISTTELIKRNKKKHVSSEYLKTIQRYNEGDIHHSHSHDMKHINDWIEQLSNKGIDLGLTSATPQYYQAQGQLYNRMMEELIFQLNISNKKIAQLIKRVWRQQYKLFLSSVDSVYNQSKSFRNAEVELFSLAERSGLHAKRMQSDKERLAFNQAMVEDRLYNSNIERETALKEAKTYKLELKRARELIFNEIENDSSEDDEDLGSMAHHQKSKHYEPQQGDGSDSDEEFKEWHIRKRMESVKEFSKELEKVHIGTTHEQKVQAKLLKDLSKTVRITEKKIRRISNLYGPRTMVDAMVETPEEWKDGNSGGNDDDQDPDAPPPPEFKLKGLNVPYRLRMLLPKFKTKHVRVMAREKVHRAIIQIFLLKYDMDEAKRSSSPKNASNNNNNTTYTLEEVLIEFCYRKAQQRSPGSPLSPLQKQNQQTHSATVKKLSSPSSKNKYVYLDVLYEIINAVKQYKNDPRMSFFGQCIGIFDDPMETALSIPLKAIDFTCQMLNRLKQNDFLPPAVFKDSGGGDTIIIPIDRGTATSKLRPFLSSIVGAKNMSKLNGFVNNLPSVKNMTSGSSGGGTRMVNLDLYIQLLCKIWIEVDLDWNKHLRFHFETHCKWYKRSFGMVVEMDPTMIMELRLSDKLIDDGHNIFGVIDFEQWTLCLNDMHFNVGKKRAIEWFDEGIKMHQMHYEHLYQLHWKETTILNWTNPDNNKTYPGYVEYWYNEATNQTKWEKPIPPTDGSSSYTSHELDFFSFSRLCKKRNILKVK